MKPADRAAGGGPNRKNDQGTCALCDKPAVEKYTPFCSKHCADIDLGRWLKGHYAIPETLGGGEDSSTDEQ